MRKRGAKPLLDGIAATILTEGNEEKRRFANKDFLQKATKKTKIPNFALETLRYLRFLLFKLLSGGVDRGPKRFLQKATRETKISWNFQSYSES
jgi:hypothetical protein